MHIFLLPGLANVGIGLVVGPEGSRAFHAKAAVIVVADPAGPGFVQGSHYSRLIFLWNESDELREQSFFRREHLQTRMADGVAAAAALQRGEVVAAAGLASELESVLGGDERFALQPLPSPRAPRDGWAVGCAVRKDATELAAGLQQAMAALRADGRLQAIFRRHRVEPLL